MKVISKVDGIDLLNMIANDELDCGTMIRHKRDDLILATNPPQPVYEYYKYTAGDKRFHRCDENGKLGAKGQQRFINYSTLNKTFEIVEPYLQEDKDILGIIEEDKDIEEIKICLKDDEYLVDKINELIKEVNKLKNK